ncbi:receptor-like protein EIX2 [Bidens hawaiensis]|uniref:receptor-like protein EIX2 n=1 Tax=Bidens hawaiensis TaxID=980011 RepID=UPI00404AF875
MSAQFSISYLSSCHLWLLVVLALVHLCLSDQNSGDVLCKDDERQALMRFKRNLIDEVDRLASWVGEKNDCCRWAGIVCDNITGHVHEIHLSGVDGQCEEIHWLPSKERKEALKQRLGGHLSPSLLELKQLKYLDLSCNNFKGIQIPSFIGSLRSLRYLNLSESRFGGMIPPQIGNISELRVLSLSLDGASMMKMQWLSSLHWLRHLDMSFVDLSKATDWFLVINTLPSLVELHLVICQLPDIHPHASRLNVTSLSVLDILGNNFGTRSIPQWIFSLTGLVTLNIGSCYFEHSLPSNIYSFRNLTSLETLYAYGNDFLNSSSVLKELPSSLKVLDISYCEISSSILHSLRNLTSLLGLDLSGNPLTNPIPNSLGNLCEVREIHFAFNNFGSTRLAYLLKSLFDCKSPSLESLTIYSSGLYGPIPNSIQRLSSLKVLNLPGNRLNGSIPDSISRLSLLEMLDLSYNQLSGNLPYGLSQLSKLTDLYFPYNLLTGVVTEAYFAKLVSLKNLYGEGNNLTLKVQVANWIPPFQVHSLFLNSWGLGPQFPSWLQWQRDLKRLDISNTHISSPIPPESFWRSFPNLTYLDMSQNKFTGKLPSLFISPLMPTHLDLSNNCFVGSLHHFLCFNGVKETEYLALGYNQFLGVVPECWEKWSSLQILKLENNNLSGEIPRTFGRLSNLVWLNMHGNKISGGLPSSLMNLSKLEILQLGRNELVGSIPAWIGTKLTVLSILNLRFNNLDGNIPDELCYLSTTQILDLAGNNLSGNIPRCFNNFSILCQETNTYGTGYFIEEDGTSTSFSASDTLFMKGQEYTYASTLELVTLLDLSSNNFSGHIPSELTTLPGLRSLNLSRNQLTGRIPENVGDMKALESFDLSVNKLSGELPINLSMLTFMSRFNVSYNNLTGRIPIGTQLQSFNESSFIGNKLCGAPLSDCRVPVDAPTNTKGDKKKDDGSDWGLIVSIVLGFITGFWIIAAP